MTYKNIIELKCDQKSSIIQYQYDHLIKNGDTAHILGYRRCSEFDLNNQPGQDFAVMRIDDTYVVGIVADGVSQSFYGNLAAEWVSLFLINKLWDSRRNCLSQSDLEQILRDFEKEKSISVKNFSIPTNLSTGVQKALAIKQQKYGSQTVFGAFVLNLEKKSACLYQVGDITFVVHHSTGDFQQIYGHPDGRWSSEGKSDFRLKIIELNNIAGIIIKSDGVSESWGKSLNPKDICRGQFRALATKHCGKDDVSFIASIFCTKEDIPLFDADEIDCNKPANLQINSKTMDALRDNKLAIPPSYNSLEKPQISTKTYNKEKSNIVQKAEEVIAELQKAKVKMPSQPQDGSVKKEQENIPIEIAKESQNRKIPRNMTRVKIQYKIATFIVATIITVVLTAIWANKFVIQTKDDNQDNTKSLSILEDNISRARDAFDREDYLSPKDKNVFYYCNTVLAMDKNNNKAREILEKTENKLMEQAQTFTRNNDTNSAKKIYVDLQRLLPSCKRCKEELDNLDKLKSLLDQADAAIKSNRLTKPKDKNAYYFVKEALILSKDNKAALELIERIKASLIKEADSFLEDDPKTCIGKYEKLIELFPEDKNLATTLDGIKNPSANGSMVVRKSTAEATNTSKSQFPDLTFKGDLISLDIKGIPLAEFLRFITDTYKVNFVCEEDVGEIKISVKAQDQPWADILRSIMKDKNIGCERKGNIVRIYNLDDLPEDNPTPTSSTKPESDPEKILKEKAVKTLKGLFGTNKNKKKKP